MGVGVGTGVYVGLGVGVGTGVNVGTGVFSSMVGGWSPAAGGSVVGSVENMPGGAVGVPSGCPPSPPQAAKTSRASAATASIVDTLR